MQSAFCCYSYYSTRMIHCVIFFVDALNLFVCDLETKRSDGSNYSWFQADAKDSGILVCIQPHYVHLPSISISSCCSCLFILRTYNVMLRFLQHGSAPFNKYKRNARYWDFDKANKVMGKLGKWLGVARLIGGALSYWILGENGKVLARAAVQRLILGEDLVHDGIGRQSEQLETTINMNAVRILLRTVLLLPNSLKGGCPRYRYFIPRWDWGWWNRWNRWQRPTYCGCTQ